MDRRLTIPWCFLVLAASLLGACASPPELTAKNAEAPEAVDLSGLWELRGEPGTVQPGPIDGDFGIRLPPRGSLGADSGGNRRAGKSGPAVWLFLESGTSLKITQTPHGLFISFDRAIVEEYTFGEKRVVSIGPVEAQRVSGWDGERFVVETLDEDGAMLSESWRLLGNKTELQRDIIVRRPGRDPVIMRQRFDRRSAE